jgi:hypothetical protein
MRSHANDGDSQIYSESRNVKRRKKARRKTKRPPGYKRPVLLLHKLQGAHGKKIRKKGCTQCKETKWLSDFYTSFKTGRGVSYSSECKICFSKRSAARIRRTRKKKNQGGDPAYQAYQRGYYHRNKEKFQEYRRQFRARNPDYFKNQKRKQRESLKKMNAETKAALTDKDCA